MTARSEQTSLDSSGQPAVSSEQTRAEEAQSDAPLTELELYLGRSTSWTLPNSEGLLQGLPGHDDTWRPAVSASENQYAQTPARIAGSDDAPNGDVSEDNSSSNDQGIRFVGQEENGENSARTEIGNVDQESPSAGLAFFDPTGRSLVYTDLSRLQRAQSFVTFTERHLSRATSSGLPDLGNILDQTPRDGNSPIITPESEAVGESRMADNEEDSNESSYEDLGAVTPLPTPPRSPVSTLHRETASITSTGATAGSSVGQEDRQEEPMKTEQSPFTKERRAQLIAVMTVDIARYSQEREWSFYQEHGYCLFPKSESPNPIHVTSVTPYSTGMLENGEGTLNTVGLLRPLLLSRRDRIRTTLPAESVQRRPVSDLPDPAEEFLVHLLHMPFVAGQGARRQEERDGQFEERSVPPDNARFRFSLVLGSNNTEPTEGDQAAYRDLFSRLMREEGEIGPLTEIIWHARRDGMDIREAALFIEHWLTFSYNHSQERYPDIEGFLSVSAVQFWTALRRGWGNWRPSQRLLDQVQGLLRSSTKFDHGVSGWIHAEFITRSDNLLSTLPQVERRRMMTWRTTDEEPGSVRFSQLQYNWVHFESAVDSTRLDSESHFSTQQLRLDRLERLIREERVINARRRVRGPDGEWLSHLMGSGQRSSDTA
jgi:hypothetical protein